MPTYLIDDGIPAKVEDALQDRVQAQIGVLIGRLGVANRDYVVLFVPTPPLEAGTEAITLVKQPQGVTKKAGGKGKSAAGLSDQQVQISDEWVVEHAHQIGQFLPGGLDVVGLYLFCPEGAFAAGNAQACRALSSMRSLRGGAGLETGRDLLLLNACSVTGKLSLKELPASAAHASGLRTSPHKLAPLLANYTSIATRYHVDTICPVTDREGQHRTHFEALLEAELQTIQESLPCSMSDNMLADEDIIADISADSHLQIRLMSPCSATLRPGEQKDGWRAESVHGRARISGAVFGQAFVHKRDTMKTAVQCLKADLQRTLRARMQKLVADAEEAAENGDLQQHLLNAGEDAHRAAFALKLPQRILLPVQAPVCFSEYSLHPKNAAEEALEAAQELLSLNLTADQLEYPEETTAALQMPESWHPLKQAVSADTAAVGQSHSVCNPLLLGAILVGALAVAGGMGYAYAVA